jgi:hypothetical protein
MYMQRVGWLGRGCGLQGSVAALFNCFVSTAPPGLDKPHPSRNLSNRLRWNITVANHNDQGERDYMFYLYPPLYEF